MRSTAMLVLLSLLAIPALLGAGTVAEKRFSVPPGDSPTYGPADAPVTVVEFLDFQ